MVVTSFEIALAYVFMLVTVGAVTVAEASTNVALEETPTGHPFAFPSESSFIAQRRLG